MLACLGADELSDAGVDTTKLNSVTVEVDAWGLHFAQELEEERLGISDKNFKILADALLVNAVGGHHDLLSLVGPQGVVRRVEVNYVATACLDGLTHDEAAALDALLLAVAGVHHDVVLQRQLLVL